MRQQRFRRNFTDPSAGFERAVHSKSINRYCGLVHALAALLTPVRLLAYVRRIHAACWYPRKSCACFGSRLLRESAMMQLSHPPTRASARCGYAGGSHYLHALQAQIWPVRTHPACCSSSTCIKGHACRAGSFKAGAHCEAGQGLAGREVVGGGHVTQEDGVAGGQVLEGHAHCQLASQRPVQQVRVG